MSDERTPLEYAIDWMEQQAERGRERPSQIKLEIAARQQAAADAIREMQAQLASVTAERDALRKAISTPEALRIEMLREAVAEIDRLREAGETKNTVINELEGELAAAQHVLRNATCGMVEARHGQRELLQKTQQLEGERDELLKDKARLEGDRLMRIADELGRHENWWRDKPEDSYGINLSVCMSINAIRQAVLSAVVEQSDAAMRGEPTTTEETTP